jgi:predicted DNA-binding transcriptional regulator AlpA
MESPNTAAAEAPQLPTHDDSGACGTKELARELGGVHPATIYRKLANDPAFPRPFKIGGRTCWLRREVRAYVEQLAAARFVPKPAVRRKVAG